MDGLDLGSIMGMVRNILPTLSYALNLFTKMFDIFTSYLGFDLSVPEEDLSDDEGAENVF